MFNRALMLAILGVLAPLLTSLATVYLVVPNQVRNPSELTYEHFLQLCLSVQGYEQAIKELSPMLAQPDALLRSSASTSIIQAASSRMIAVSQYNADALVASDEGFLGSTLPRRLLLDGEVTRCN